MYEKEFFLEHDGLQIHCKLDLPFAASAVKTAGSDSASADSDSSFKCPVLVLIHGFTGWMDEDHLTGITNAANEAGAAVLRADMYGHGRSDGEFKNHTILKWIDQMSTIMEYACSLPFASTLILSGHSQGGLIAMLAGAIWQDRLDAIIPLSPAVRIPAGARSGNLLGGHFDPADIPPEIDLSKPDKKRILNGNYIRMAKLFSAEWAAGSFTKPVLIIHGDADKTVPVEHSIEIAAQYSNCTLKIIKGDDHDYHYHLDEVCRVVQDFLKEMI